MTPLLPGQASTELAPPSAHALARVSRRGSGRMIAAAPLFAAGAVALVALAGRWSSGRSKVSAWLRGFFGGGRESRGRLARTRLSPAVLRASLLSRTRAQVAARFGPPRAAFLGRASGGPEHRCSFWRADSWYYVLDTASRTAMAIRFEGKVAVGVEFIGPAGEPAAS